LDHRLLGFRGRGPDSGSHYVNLSDVTPPIFVGNLNHNIDGPSALLFYILKRNIPCGTTHGKLREALQRVSRTVGMNR
jgi:hypothetical protein